jgi:hypothetical protein
MSKQYYLKINSADRLNATTTTPASFSIATDRPLTGLSLKSIMLPITCYNISSSNNLVPFYDTSAKVATLSPGFYTTALFLTNLTAALNAASSAGVYSCTQDVLTSRLIITCTVPFTLSFSGALTSAAEVMGFNAVNSASAALSQTGVSPINLSTTLCYYMSINGASGTRNMNSTTTGFVIPALSISQGISYYEVPLNMPQSIHFESARVLDINIYDDNRRLLTFSANWYMICEAEESKYVRY